MLASIESVPIKINGPWSVQVFSQFLPLFLYRDHILTLFGVFDCLHSVYLNHEFPLLCIWYLWQYLSWFPFLMWQFLVNIFLHARKMLSGYRLWVSSDFVGNIDSMGELIVYLFIHIYYFCDFAAFGITLLIYFLHQILADISAQWHIDNY